MAPTWFCVTAVLMTLVDVALVSWIQRPGGWDPMILFLLLPLCNAALGTLAARWGSVSWPNLVRATLLAAPATVMALEHGSGSSSSPELGWVLFWAALCTSGLFLLPLVDPRVRREQGVQSPWWALAGALLVFVITILPMTLRSGGVHGPDRLDGFAALGLGGLGGVALTGVGSLLVLVGRRLPGLWIGGVGVVLAVLSVLFWMVTGSPFPP